MNPRSMKALLILLALLSAGECLAAVGQPVVLKWTASGDDGNIGRALLYEIRYSNAPITQANYTQAKVIYYRIPRPPGSAESLAVTVIPGRDHFFAIRTQDEAGNVSMVSNVVRLSALTDVPGGAHGVVTLSVPWPNPARRSTRLALDLPQAAHCRVEVFDGQGRRVRLLADHVLAPGHSELDWDLRTDRGDRVASGVYFMRANVGTWDQLSARGNKFYR